MNSLYVHCVVCQMSFNMEQLNSGTEADASFTHGAYIQWPLSSLLLHVCNVMHSMSVLSPIIVFSCS